MTDDVIPKHGMTIKDAREAMAGLPDDGWLIISGDAEGNHASPLAAIVPGLYRAEQPWSGEFVAIEDTDPDDPNEHQVWVLEPIN